VKFYLILKLNPKPEKESTFGVEEIAKFEKLKLKNRLGMSVILVALSGV
jgi:hypothetical protein